MNPAVEEIAALVRQGNKVEAIKRLRQVSGLGLKDAHDLIENDPSPAALERVVRRLPASSAAPGAGIGSAEVRRLATDGQSS